ncbi:hypothetical protein B9Z19DRAFT_791696 [Tuber borchii]|uniref:Uncharacterized protein n=1 Tax=Tuber borchii TaxID=42251 RepID=A0A2T6ZWD8_TUBBO|nr:hypothetical protein B9Z19DRAFT_791696 [Tuber borchii]
MFCFVFVILGVKLRLGRVLVDWAAGPMTTQVCSLPPFHLLTLFPPIHPFSSHSSFFLPFIYSSILSSLAQSIPTMLSKNSLTLQNLTSDSQSLPLCIPSSGVNVRSLVAYFNQKSNEQATFKTRGGKVHLLVAYFNQKSHEQAIPQTSAPHHHNWKTITGEKVKSLVLNFSRMGMSPPGSNSRVSSASLVTVDEVYSQVGKMVVENDCASFESKGAGRGGAPMKCTLPRVNDTLPYVVSSPKPIGSVDESAKEDLGAEEMVVENDCALFESNGAGRGGAPMKCTLPRVSDTLPYVVSSSKPIGSVDESAQEDLGAGEMVVDNDCVLFKSKSAGRGGAPMKCTLPWVSNTLPYVVSSSKPIRDVDESAQEDLGAGKMVVDNDCVLFKSKSAGRGGAPMKCTLLRVSDALLYVVYLSKPFGSVDESAKEDLRAEEMVVENVCASFESKGAGRGGAPTKCTLPRVSNTLPYVVSSSKPIRGVDESAQEDLADSELVVDNDCALFESKAARRGGAPIGVVPLRRNGYETQEQAIPTSAPRHHNWKPISGEKVKSLVLHFSRMGISLPRNNNQISIAGSIAVGGVHFQVRIYNQKVQGQAAPQTSAPRHHDWKPILGEKVRSLVQNLSRLGISLPESSSRISIPSPVTIDEVFSRVRRMVAHSDRSSFGSKGARKGGAPIGIAPLRRNGYKFHEEAIPQTSAPCHHDWKPISGEKVKSLVLNFSRMGISLPGSISGEDRSFFGRGSRSSLAGMR